MKISTFFKPFLELYRYFLKGARVDAALINLTKTRLNKGNVIPPGATPRTDNKIGSYWERDDLDIMWNITTDGILLLKNNSTKPAYDIKLINAGECFSAYKKPQQLLSLDGGKSVEISISFEQMIIAHTGPDADALLSIIPAAKERFPLKISYKNEGGHIFYTIFYVSTTNPQNEYWI
jgi:hypothetical protein